jgi:hypothetical protein
LSNRKWLKQDFPYFNDLQDNQRELRFSLVLVAVAPQIMPPQNPALQHIFSRPCYSDIRQWLLLRCRASSCVALARLDSRVKKIYAAVFCTSPNFIEVVISDLSSANLPQSLVIDGFILLR